MQEFILSTEQRKNVLLWALFLFLGCFLGYLVLKNEPYYWFASVSIFLAVIVLISYQISIYIIIFSVFFADWLAGLGLIPGQLTWFSDIMLIYLSLRVIVLSIIFHKSLRIPIIWPIFLFILTGIISTLINSESPIMCILSFRQNLKFALLFYLIPNLDLSERFLKTTMQILIFLLILQIPVGIAKLPFYGQGEQAIGTYAVHGGSLSTVLPLIGISIFLAFYFFKKPQFRYILFCLAFILFSIIGGKRAFIFFASLLVPFLAWQAGRKNLFKFSLVLPIVVSGFLLCVYFVPSLRPALRNPRHLIEFPLSYTTGESDAGEASGRLAAAKVGYKKLKENIVTFIFGFGPGTYSESFFKKFEGKLRTQLPIYYGGNTQLVTTALEYGIIGVILFMWMIYFLFKINEKFFIAVENQYWRSISFGFKGILFVYFLGFFYATVFKEDVSALIFWLFAAIIYSIQHQKQIFDLASH